MQIVKRGFLIFLALLTAFFLLASLRGRRQKVSEFENRTLAATRPSLSGVSWTAAISRAGTTTFPTTWPSGTG